MSATQPPELPQTVSPDGRELWDWAAKASKFIHDEARRKELLAQIRKVTCGDCQHWMKSRECPRERNVGGFSRGPSMNGPICEKFSETPQSVELRAKWKLELSELEANPTRQA